jgi:putative YhdH/YhfP family quinone oxidoreductase
VKSEIGHPETDFMHSPPDTFGCYLVRKTAEEVQASFEQRPLRELPAGDVRIRVRCSSLNYKDAMAATGHAGIAKKYPHVPGIDVAGVVEASESPEFQPGDEVFSTGHELGVERWGGWAEYAQLPAEWVLRRPEGLTLEQTMILGTAGFTGAQCVAALVDHRVTKHKGGIVVTGATGGVGILAVKILAKLGYKVVAVSGKEDQKEWLIGQGATAFMARSTFVDQTDRPLLMSRWAGGVDTVGGAMLSSLIRGVEHRGCVAACGVVGGASIPITVYPFILRGVTLAGIDSAWCPDDQRAEIWRLLSGEWKPDNLESVASFVTHRGIGDVVADILKGRIRGRVVIRFDDDEE